MPHLLINCQAATNSTKQVPIAHAPKRKIVSKFFFPNVINIFYINTTNKIKIKLDHVINYSNIIKFFLRIANYILFIILSRKKNLQRIFHLVAQFNRTCIVLLAAA